MVELEARRVMRNTFSEALYQAATANPDIYIVVADISPAGSMAKFSNQYPERFINVGVAEQSMIGICAGLALKGCQPFAYTIATFSLYRPFEMVRDDLCYQNLPVTVVGMGAGVIYSTLGGTHHTQEDIAIAGALPNMQIIAPCDPAECTEATRYCAAQKNGPVYLRIGKAGEPNSPTRRSIPGSSASCATSSAAPTSASSPMASSCRRRCSSPSGSRRRANRCRSSRATRSSRSTVEGIADALQRHKQVIVIEEHAPQGGLAPRTKQIAWDIQATLPARHLHAAGRVHPQLRQPRRPAGGARH